jgi:hypothetical protein
MAYLRIKTIKGGRYFYIVKSVRKGGKVFPKTLEYLGRDPSSDRLKRAMRYWKVATPMVLHESLLRGILKCTTAVMAFKREGNDEVSQWAASGTFVKIGKVRGILTAAHVVEDLFADDVVAMGIIASDERHLFKIPVPGKALRAIEWAPRKSDAWGPDVTLIVLPEVDANRVERLGRYFYDLEANPDHRNTVWVVYGAPVGLQRLGQVDDVLGVGAHIATTRRFITKNGLHYVQVTASMDAPSEAPDNLRGISGGGLWIFKMARKGSVSRFTGDHVFGGVAYFAQHPKPNQPGFIRCHEGQDIVRVAVPRIRAAIERGEGWRSR